MVKEFCPKNEAEWLLWMQKNHDKGEGIWLVQYKKGTENYNISYPEALDIALCYGWIDSTIAPIDDEKYKRYFSKRNKNSAWSRVNKNKIEKLIKNGKMTEHGFKAIELAKENGSYYLLDNAEDGIIPAELEEILNKNQQEKIKFENLGKREKRHIIYSITKLKTQEAKKRNIEKIVQYLKNI